MFKKLIHWLIALFVLVSNQASGAVILQYHHVSEKLPAVTSVSASTFKQHLTYLKEQQFNVVPLTTIIETLRKGKSLPAKTIAITFDDGYDNNIEAAAPILESFSYPYTIFVNPKLIDEKKSYVMTWDELRDLAKKGATIANHSAEHEYLHITRENESLEQWRKRIKQDLTWSQARIKQEIGHDIPYVAYPYGEFNNSLKELVNELGLVGIGQHSGAVGVTTDWTRVPRFPASGIYSKLDTLSVKMQTQAFNIKKLEYSDTVTADNQPTLTIHFQDLDNSFHQSQFACYVSGIGQATINWLSPRTVTVRSPKPLAAGRTRYNCTAPKKGSTGSYLWFSQPWVIVNN
ncbi:polysaccharide deacetylase family protein [Pseudoalteromonas sp. T1lg65]|uniref:polysaccharide deacetylase family protein n=1 Tax=Pseudoalteromonas sp. T1lg65 TaxID=2077101 RepID=UPI003F7B0A13